MKMHRLISLLVALITLFIVVASFYIENVLGMKPCFLCLVQRALFGLIFVVSITAFFHHTSTTMTKIYLRSSLLFGLVGLAAAARQVWVQHQPMSVMDNCLPRFSYLVEHMPASKALELFRGTTHCSEYVWTYQGLSLAAWSMLSFGLILALILLQAVVFRLQHKVVKD